MSITMQNIFLFLLLLLFLLPTPPSPPPHTLQHTQPSRELALTLSLPLPLTLSLPVTLPFPRPLPFTHPSLTAADGSSAAGALSSFVGAAAAAQLCLVASWEVGFGYLCVEIVV